MSEALDPEKPATLAHRAEYALYRAAEGLLGLASLPTVVRAGEVLGLAAWAISPKHRRLVTRNLRIATAAAAPGSAELRRLVRETFARAGGNLLGSLRAGTMEPEPLRDHIAIEGLEHLRAPVGSGRGVVVVWSHMGNWEVLAQLVPLLGGTVRGGPIYRPLENPLLDRLTVRRRTRQGAVLFNKHDGFLGPAALLRGGGVLTVMSDQRAGGHGELCPFFGRLSSCTPLPGLLARRTGAAMVTISIRSEAPGYWRLTLRPVPDKARTPEILQHLEHAMRDQLSDVFWFHDRWRTDPVRPLSFYTKETPTDAARQATHPTRLVATLPAGDAAAVECLKALLELRPDARIDVLDPGDLAPLPEDPRILPFPCDLDAPEEQLEGLLRRCDDSHPVPLDFALLLDGDARLARAARRHQLRGIIGAGVAGKPWTRGYPVPTDAAGWRQLAAELVLTRKNRKPTP
jgi:KDO2-lipid IV(A) lauroyltransferase